MRRRHILFSVLLILVGISVLAFILLRFGRASWHAIAAVNIGMFCAYLIAQLVLTVGLASCWYLVLPRHGGRAPFWLLVWARMLRDAAGEFLPFSYAGGLVAGARAVALCGVQTVDAAASTIADIVLETFAEVLFLVLGLLLLACIEPNTRLWSAGCAGIVMVLAAMIGLAALYRGPAAVSFMRRTLSRALAPATRRIGLMQDAFGEIRARPGQIARAACMHFICAIAGGVVTWLGFHILGAALSLSAAISLEALMHALLAFGVAVPARIGVQEAAYLLLGTIYGVPADLAISFSLLRRARNFVISIPVLLSWQFFEARRLAAAPRRAGARR